MSGLPLSFPPACARPASFFRCIGEILDPETRDKIIFSVADEIVCITGSSRGLGKALARGFAENGSKVIISSFDSEELEQVKNEFAADNLSVEAVVADATRRQDCELLVSRAIERFGNLDVLICNAGIDIILFS